VLAAMRERPDGNADDWVPIAYADTPRQLWPVAKRSLLAHLERIEALGLAHSTSPNRRSNLDPTHPCA